MSAGGGLIVDIIGRDRSVWLIRSGVFAVESPNACYALGHRRASHQPALPHQGVTKNISSSSVATLRQPARAS